MPTKRPTTRRKRKNKPGAGRPFSTGVSLRPVISFRAPSAEAYDQLDAEAKARDTTVNLLAQERVFGRRPG